MFASAAAGAKAAAESFEDAQSLFRQAARKIPREWGNGSPAGKKVGWRWQDPKYKGNGVRVDRGVPGSPHSSQRVDHVIVRSGGKVLGRDGRSIAGSIEEFATQAHIPMSEWRNWKSWSHP
jgi:hypothetical protein